MRDLHDVMAKEPVWKSDKTDSGKPDTGKQASLQGRVQRIHQPVRRKHQPTFGAAAALGCWEV